jgi:hypothetical protein
MAMFGIDPLGRDIQFSCHARLSLHSSDRLGVNPVSCQFRLFRPFILRPMISFCSDRSNGPVPYA